MRWRPQRLREPNSWQAEGFPDESEARRWADRACGAVCVQAVVNHYTGEEIPLWEIISRGVGSGAYGPNGWVHAGLADLLKSYGVRAKAKALPARVAALKRALADDHVLICSVGLGYLPTGRRSGHLVIVHRHADGPPATLATMDPSDLGPHVASLAADRFVAAFSGRVIACGPMR